MPTKKTLVHQQDLFGLPSSSLCSFIWSIIFGRPTLLHYMYRDSFFFLNLFFVSFRISFLFIWRQAVFLCSTSIVELLFNCTRCFVAQKKKKKFFCIFTLHWVFFYCLWDTCKCNKASTLPWHHLRQVSTAAVWWSTVQPMIEQLSIKTYLKMIYANDCFGKANLISTKSSCGVTAEILISVYRI